MADMLETVRRKISNEADDGLNREFAIFARLYLKIAKEVIRPLVVVDAIVSYANGEKSLAEALLDLLIESRRKQSLAERAGRIIRELTEERSDGLAEEPDATFGDGGALARPVEVAPVDDAGTEGPEIVVTADRSRADVEDPPAAVEPEARSQPKPDYSFDGIHPASAIR